ncbi:tyrosine-type recombinase/integrase [Rhodoblastus sp.]|uniref:tyrosine-type recombinase/integrase n=1 Tax=Rhodoblastus sp. TaxID=1962975 RepID=UPI0026316E82|nr:tyrosine-type recombinase/integrase [Rhodoblastus sp.]
MSIYKPKKSPNFDYDFRVKGHRFFGTTGTSNRREAERIEREKKDAARREIEKAEAASAGPLTIDLAAGRYWDEVGQHHAAPKTTFSNLARLVAHFGRAKRLDEIATADVAELVARRRGETVRGRKTIRDPQNPKKRLPAPLVSPATVNRSTIEPLQKLFNRAKNVWGAKLPREPAWKSLLLKEPQERVREIRATEETALDEAIRPDYRPLVAFARASGLRLAECLLRKDQVHILDGVIETKGKGGRTIRKPITSEMRAILVDAMQQPTDVVFTYRAARAKKGNGGFARGDHLPITASGLKTLWRRAKRAGLPADLRFHDLRHDFATTLLRETGNLKLVQKALGHAKIETTTRYAHVLDDEVAAGMEAAARARLKKRAKARARTG